MNQIAELLNLKIPFVLASQSPRRRRLLEQLGFEFTVEPSGIDEDESNGLPPVEFVTKLALDKASDIARNRQKPALILGSDTIVVLDGRIINKPADKNDAVRMLKELSGNTHTVYTGIALIESPGGRSITAVQNTDVRFRDLEDKEIEAYVNSGSPLDKAGAYGIQDDFGAVFVDEIHGCYYNIVGLPLELLYTTMKKFLNQ